MATPGIIWRNPETVERKRLWNRARQEEGCSLYIVVRSGPRANEWEGMPNLEMIEGGAATRSRRGKSRSARAGK